MATRQRVRGACAMAAVTASVVAASLAITAAPVGAARCGSVGVRRAAQAAPAPFCDHPYSIAQTQDGTVYRSTVDVDGNPIDLALDVYEPVGDPPAPALRPVLLWMHGGYFLYGDRTDDPATFEDFASRGFVVVSIDYRLRDLPDSDGLSVPTPEAVADALEDAVAAVQWIHANAAALRIDPASVVAAGYSAGAITALGLAHQPTAIAAPGSPTPIAAAVSFSGLDLFGDPPSRPDDVPVLMYNGDQDDIVPLGAARQTCRLTVLAGSECDLVVLPGQSHTPGDTPEYQQSVEWLAAHGISQLAGCPTFDVPTVDFSAPTTTTSTPTTSTTPTSTSTPTAPATSGAGAEAPGATPVPGQVAFTG